jgi:hypothetical protein
MLYNSIFAAEVNRVVHEERLLEAEKHHRLMRDLELANQLEIKESPFHQMRKAMNRMMSLFF